MNAVALVKGFKSVVMGLLWVGVLLLMLPGAGQAEPLILSGPDAPVTGQGYSATGGCSPYAWSINKGTITAAGVVTVSSQCGKATVTVTDACGGTAAKDVKMSSGTWVTVYSGCSPDHDPLGAFCDIADCYDSPDLDPSPVVQRYRSKQPAWICPNCCRWLLRETIREWRCSSEAKCVDQDRDGVYAKATTCVSGSDCNDVDATIRPGAAELCDGRDNDCDTQTDEGLSRDADGDGHYTADSCLVPRDDCDDQLGAVYPGHAEICGDDIDNDCNGQTDEGCCPTITSFTASDDSLNPATGEFTAFHYESDQPLDRATVTINGEDVGMAWNGRLAGKLAAPGTYAAVLEIQKDDCVKTSAVSVTVEPYTGCQLRLPLGSSVNLASGALTDSFPLFASAGTGPNLAVTLFYDSLSAYCGPLGTGWSHSYDLVLNENGFGEVVLRQGKGEWKLYKPGGAGYFSPPGDTAILTRDAAGLFTLTHQDGARYEFGDDRKIARIIDRNGNTLTFAYDGSDLASVTDGYGRAVTFGYAGGKLSSINDPGGNSYQVSVGASLDSITLTDGSTWQFGYGDNAFLVAKVDPVGNLTTYQYDEQLRVTGSTDPEGRSRSIAYPSASETVRTSAFTEKDGSVWLYTYEVQSGNLVGKTDPVGNVTTYSYDARHHLTAKAEPGIGTTTYSYDALGNMTSSTDPAGNATRYTYNAFGQVTSVSEAGGATTVYNYDERGNLTMVGAPHGGTTTYQYDGQGRLASITNATGEATILSYDAQGNVAGVIGPDGRTTTYLYDVNGRRTSATDADGYVTRFEYDSKGQLLKVIDAKGNMTCFEYDAKGNRSRIIDANGRVTTFAYNFAGQMVSMTDALGYTTTFAYGGSADCSSCGGGADKLTVLTDAKGQATLFRYDPLGRLIRETDALGHVIAYNYDAAGHVTGQTDPNGQTTQYNYDALGRLTAKTYPDGTQATFDYDARGNLLAAANASIAYSFTYDAGDRLTGVTDSFNHTIAYTYDAAGKRTRLNSSNGIAIDYAYDDAGRLAQISSSAGTFAFGYDALGRRNQLLFPNGVATTYGYDDLGRLTNLVSAGGASIITENHYTFDKVGNRLSNRDARHTLSYDYDAIYRLTEAVSDAPGNSGKATGKGKDTVTAKQNQKEIYVYDPVGNRAQTDKMRSFAYNAGNELLSVDGTRYSYDVNGSRTGRSTAAGTTTYTWDAENRLTQVASPDGKIVTFAYDPFGRRIAKTTDGRTTRYTYDSEDILFETENGRLGNVYLHGPGIDEPLALLDSQGAAYYHADGLGSIVAMTDDKARVVQSYEYDSYGNRHDLQNRIKQPYTYTGREFDRETRLYYYRARYYDAEVGRFVSEDPIGFAGGDANLYGYVQNRPSVFIDPIGLAWFRPQHHEYVVGRPGTPVEPGKGIGRIIDDYVPAGHTFGANHDSLVNWATSEGAPDWLVNIPSMGAVYVASYYQEMYNSIIGVFGVDIFEHELPDVCE